MIRALYNAPNLYVMLHSVWSYNLNRFQIGCGKIPQFNANMPFSLVKLAISILISSGITVLTSGVLPEKTKHIETTFQPHVYMYLFSFFQLGICLQLSFPN